MEVSPLNDPNWAAEHGRWQLMVWAPPADGFLLAEGPLASLVQRAQADPRCYTADLRILCESAIAEASADREATGGELLPWQVQGLGLAALALRLALEEAGEPVA